MIANDLSIYSDYADEWWKSGSPRFKSLHNITPFRLNIIYSNLGSLNKLKVADLGCGGGLISIPLINDGALVTGVDISQESIECAKLASKDGGNFICSDIRNTPLSSESFDVVLLADVLDHIKDFDRVLKEAFRILKPGGRMFVGTINRTFRSWFFAIFLGEGLKLIPPGTHDRRLFIKPYELIEEASRVGFTFQKIQGETPNILATIKSNAISLRLSKSLSLAYSAFFQKPFYEK